MNLAALRRFLVGERLPTERAIHERLPKFLALPVFASDAISSSAYAIEEILIVLVLAGTAGLIHAGWIAGAIALLFIIVAISYRQTVMAYPSGGGAYIVAHDNLGQQAGLIAAAALLTDYVLTVAVSISAGVAAVISAAPGLASYRETLGIVAVAIITLANLRGARESGTLFAPPVYLFVTICVLIIPVGLVRLVLSGPQAAAPSVVLHATEPVTIFLLLRAFAGGCAALTGIEAISNGVPAFRPPEARNAAMTLLWDAGICVTIFVGLTILTQLYGITPDPTGRQTVLSQLGRRVFGGEGFFYFWLQAATAAILILAANTSFADFPRLSSILARDGYAPRQLANLGDRLVFANGILLLGVFSVLLIVVFRGETHLLIPLYAIGVFVSFTLSQAGMVVHWRKLRTEGWRGKAVVNAIGAAATAIVLVVVASVKFIHGAWIVLVIIPLGVLGFRAIHRHYQDLSEALPEVGVIAPRAVRHAVIVLVPGLRRGILTALAYAKTISEQVEAVFVEIDPKETPRLRERWRELHLDVPLTVLKSPWRSLTEPIIHYTRTLRAEKHVELVTVVIPEFVTTRWWHGLLHNQSGLMLKLALLNEPGVVVTNVRYYAGKPREGGEATSEETGGAGPAPPPSGS